MSTEYQYDEELELYLNEDGDEFTEDEMEALMELADCYRDDIACGLE